MVPENSLPFGSAVACTSSSLTQNTSSDGAKTDRAPLGASIDPRNSAAPPAFRTTSVASFCASVQDVENEPKSLFRTTSHVPVRSTHGENGVPPPHAPAVQVSPVVQALPSSHVAPSPSGMHIDAGGGVHA